jgi:hypothetical protein
MVFLIGVPLSAVLARSGRSRARSSSSSRRSFALADTV